jgi:hypothetical protein
MKDPAFLFYPNDWIGGTMGMTFEEKGAYLELLMMQFNRGHMTSHMIGQTVGQLWDKIQDKFKVDEAGLYYNERLEIEKEKRKSFTESRRNNISGTNQYTKKVGHKKGHMDGHTTSHMENENENENINNNKKVYPPELIELNEKCKKYFNPKYINETSLECFDKLIRINKYTIEDIQKAILNARNEEFWGKNFLSPVKLRDKDKNGVLYIDRFLNLKPKIEKPIEITKKYIDLSKL